jgi:DNA-binding YbaB/EbfC family protein
MIVERKRGILADILLNVTAERDSLSAIQNLGPALRWPAAVRRKGKIMFKGMGDMLKQASQMKEKMAEMQEALAKQQVEASTGGGMVKVTANGNNEILHIHIDEELINMKDRAILEDLVAGAINEVHRKVKDLAQAEMTKLTGGIKIPGLFP